MIYKFYKKYGLKKLSICLGDFIYLTLSVIFSLSFYYSSGTIHSVNPFNNFVLIILYSLVVIIILVTFRYQNLYKERYYTSVVNQIIPFIKSLFFASILLITITFLFKTEEFQDNSRFHLFLFILCSIIFISFYRFVIIRLLVNIKNNNAFNRRILAIGAGEAGKNFAREIKSVSKFLELVGFIDDDENKIGKKVEGIRVLGNLNKLNLLAKIYNIDEIFITIKSITYNKLMFLIEKAKDTKCQVNLISPHFGVIERKFDSKEYKNLKSVSINYNITDIYINFLKRFLDIFISIVSLIILIPFFVIVFLIIKLSSFGPVFYKTYVVGKYGKQFIWYKFRTMRTNSDNSVHKNHLEKIIKENQSVQKIENDIRVTKIGKYLRKFSLDELPQLINVLKGDMSLVGPRPCLPYEYDIMDDWHKRRTQVIPGMSGLWQITGRNKSDVTFNDSLILDLYYVDNVSLWLDFKIILKTIPVVILGKGGN